MTITSNADTIIMGGGVTGCSIAYHLQQAGARVTVIEREEIASESSSAAAGMLAPIGGMRQGDAFTDLLIAGRKLNLELLPQIQATSGVQTEYHRPGSLRIANSEAEAQRLRERFNDWQNLQQEVRWLSGDEAREIEPLLGEETCAAVYAPHEGSMKPAGVTRAYAGAARAIGVRFIERCEVIGIEREDYMVTAVRTSTGDILPCQHLVVAAGAWSGRCGDWLGFDLPVTPTRGQILALHQPEPPLTHILSGEGVYLIPKPDNTIFVGATVEKAGFDKRLTAGAITTLLNSAIRVAPSLEQAFIARMWAGLRPGTPDNRPILGPAPGWHNVTLATGHNGVGFELSAITGKLISELILTGQTPSLLQPFGVERFTQ
ncbi:glycine oxidase ThiO [Ktedonobacter sp. SOSP1-85]|uniref:glycine oxidase ThiO n=1 Tax=Ktedonobacter sp. SOSP1-85 TaxID=2778367 RepID=UPI0019167E76|nr:glycine oxidase ThiO [Ktedonobacter sp. SOSP1-85]GHO81185.1 glycine oxidase ThiO [Ktedonobacter sp. SOSP1-85]